MSFDFCRRLLSKSRLFILFLFIPFSLYSQDKFLDFVYVDANTGQSSGGHSALRFGDTVFHFQYYPDGIFRAVREPYSRFSYSYNIYSNRTSKIARIRLKESDFEKIQEGFDKVSVLQFKHLNNLDSLRKDLRFLSELASPKRKINIRSLGYFAPGNRSPWMDKIREELYRKKGKEWIGKVRSSLKAELEKAVEEKRFESFQVLPEIAKGKYPFYKGGPSSWFLSRLEKLAALELLSGDFGLSEDTIFESSSEGFSEEERKRLVKLQESLFENSIGLLEENDSGWGNAFLVNLARILVLEKSLENDRATFLISFPENIETISVSTILENKDSIKKDSGILLEAARNIRQEFGTSNNPSEDLYRLWEDLENRDWELRTGMSRNISIRNTFDPLSPNLSGERIYPFPIPSEKELKNLISVAEKREKDYYSELRIFYDFKLIRRNCTTELFNVLDGSLSEEEYRSALGKRIDPVNSLAFIPFLAYEAIMENWAPEETVEELSYRKEELRKMYEKGSSWKTYLRESNTLSSSLYKSNAEDSSFLFFTDDILLLRPVYGVINLGWGLGNFGLGIFTLPFDKGKRVQDGLQSAFFSLPELIFFNIRKGSFPNAPDKKREIPSPSKTNE
ncbi:hypothetical protein EHQ61_07760 [Leptospira wolffii]|nr:hypothetical protein EHQ61_07760 [Leptospira wolffii]